ncbi:MAG: pantoate--beta-alanine ligase [Candidatus Omnitrophica bacterium]|nr:pantoate--beta-alanine ligase [Candidatus Omnitrophota bacterium]MDD5500865.1 pantoate--beta-alanine ligase [Candidatus Omnitrophota bacterium]
MKIIRQPGKMSVEMRKCRRAGKSIGLVPTMGALHEGHFSLIRKAREENDIVAVSIFVNPAQFGPGEDFKKYPRQSGKDTVYCRRMGVDFVFSPCAKDMYPEGYSTFVNVDGLSDALCGSSRPGHFRGVATVLSKLFNIVLPDTVYMGQKDAQQAVIVSRMARDLNFPLKVKVSPTVRGKDGLALSSRNTYLKEKDRASAAALFKSLKLAETMVKNGQRNSARIIKSMKNLIEKNAAPRIDYIKIVDRRNLKAVQKVKSGDLIALAVRFGRTRLIDNMIIKDA